MMPFKGESAGRWWCVCECVWMCLYGMKRWFVCVCVCVCVCVLCLFVYI